VSGVPRCLSSSHLILRALSLNCGQSAALPAAAASPCCLCWPSDRGSATP
jgi:hypothetical protein